MGKPHLQVNLEVSIHGVGDPRESTTLVARYPPERGDLVLELQPGEELLLYGLDAGQAYTLGTFLVAHGVGPVLSGAEARAASREILRLNALWEQEHRERVLIEQERDRLREAFEPLREEARIQAEKLRATTEELHKSAHEYTDVAFQLEAEKARTVALTKEVDALRGDAERREHEAEQRARRDLLEHINRVGAVERERAKLHSAVAEVLGGLAEVLGVRLCDPGTGKKPQG